MRKTRGTPLPTELVLDLLLVLFEDPRGSGDLAEAVGELRGSTVPLATFYRHLQKSLDLGWVEIRADGTQGRPGRPERLYQISDDGGRALRAGLERQQRRVSRASALGLLTERPQ